MKTLSKAILLPVVMTLMSMQNHAQAAFCYEQSPAHASQGDEYYDIDVTPPLSRRDKDKLTDLFKTIQGRWTGSGKKFTCEGPERRPKEIHRKYKAAVDIAAATNFELRIRSEKEFVEEKTKKSDVTDLLKKNSHYHIVSLTKTGMSAIEKHRRAAGRYGSSFWEIITDIKVRNNKLRIRTTRHLNGYLASEETNELIRGR